MRLLIANELYECGGAENVFRDEVRLCLDAGHVVRSLSFDPDFIQSEFPDHHNFPIDGGDAWKLRIRMIGDRALTNALLRLLEDFQPDIIHVHNAVNSMLPLCSALGAYRAEHPSVIALQTLHDYGVVCPKSWCIHDDGSVCSGYSVENCFGNKCCLKFQDKLKLPVMARMNSARRLAFDRLVSPSESLVATCAANDIATDCVRNPFKAPQVSCSSFSERDDVIVYVGAVSERKGCTNLIKAWKSSDLARAGWRLRIIGSVERDYEDTFTSLLEDANGINVLGKLSREETLEEIVKAKYLIAPSLWIENYPTTVLEALACGTVCLGSNRGGIPELIGKDGILFNPLSVPAITKVLNECLIINRVIWESWSKSGVKRVRRENDPQVYLGSLFGTEFKDGE